MTADHFGDDVARHYDDDVAEMFDASVVEPAVDLLADLAADDGALEFGIGTGRIALPLARRGVRVHGIELSTAMIDRLREKPDASAVAVTIGDFATADAGSTFGVVYLVFNTIMNVTSQDGQVDCFVNAARHLRPGGHFVVEVDLPRLQRLPPGETFQPFLVTPTRLGFDEYDVASQSLTSHHYVVDGDRVAISAVPFRYVWPAELDLMARVAGLTLRDRWSDWDRSRFMSDSTKHVSLWAKPG